MLYGDDVIIGEDPACGQLCRAYEAYGKGVVGIKQVTPEQILKYSSLKVSHIDGNLFHVTDMIEKPSPDTVQMCIRDRVESRQVNLLLYLQVYEFVLHALLFFLVFLLQLLQLFLIELRSIGCGARGFGTGTFCALSRCGAGCTKCRRFRRPGGPGNRLGGRCV